VTFFFVDVAPRLLDIVACFRFAASDRLPPAFRSARESGGAGGGGGGARYG